MDVMLRKQPGKLRGIDRGGSLNNEIEFPKLTSLGLL